MSATPPPPLRLTEVLTAHAAALARAGHLGEAERWLTSMLQAPPLQAEDDAGPRCLLGKVQAQQGRLDEAKASLRAALQSDPAHAGARAALASLECGQPLRHRRMLVGGGLALCMLAVGGAWAWQRLRADGLPQAAPAVGAAASAERAAPVAPSIAAPTLPATAPAAPLTLQGVHDYAALVLALRRFGDIATLRPQVVSADAQGLTVRLDGSVASAHVLGQVRAVVARHPKLRVDAAALTIDHRYRVRRGDSFSSIAARVYGRADRWPLLWRANRQGTQAPHRLVPGTLLVVP